MLLQCMLTSAHAGLHCTCTSHTVALTWCPTEVLPNYLCACSMQVRRDHGDVPVLKALTTALGANMWFNCILVLTHGAAAPPDNNSGQMTYEVYANQRTHGLQQAIRHAASPSLRRSPLVAW